MARRAASALLLSPVASLVGCFAVAPAYEVTPKPGDPTYTPTDSADQEEPHPPRDGTGCSAEMTAVQARPLPEWWGLDCAPDSVPFEGTTLEIRDGFVSSFRGTAANAADRNHEGVSARVDHPGALSLEIVQFTTPEGFADDETRELDVYAEGDEVREPRYPRGLGPYPTTTNHTAREAYLWGRFGRQDPIANWPDGKTVFDVAEYAYICLSEVRPDVVRGVAVAIYDQDYASRKWGIGDRVRFRFSFDVAMPCVGQWDDLEYGEGEWFTEPEHGYTQRLYDYGGEERWTYANLWPWTDIPDIRFRERYYDAYCNPFDREAACEPGVYPWE